MKFLKISIADFYLYKSLSYQELIVFEYIKYYIDHNQNELSYGSISKALNIKRENLIRCINKLVKDKIIRRITLKKKTLYYLPSVDKNNDTEKIISELSVKWHK